MRQLKVPRWILTVTSLIMLVSGTMGYLLHTYKGHAASPIQHIVFMLKENHTFDDYFGAFPGVNGATTGIVKVNGQDMVIPLNPAVDKPNHIGGCHSWQCAQIDYDSGAMDAFNQGNCATPPYLCYEVASQSFIPNYWSLAQQYILNDNTFSSL